MDNRLEKLLIVERKLVSNRGHHHTQVAALKVLFPNAETYILAGEGYDGFLGEAIGTIAVENFKVSRLRAKLKHGSLTQKIAAGFRWVFAGCRRLPKSAFGQNLIDISMRLALSSDDMIIIPTADIDSLESAVELSRHSGDNAPRVVLRFLSSTIGEKKENFLVSRLHHSIDHMPDNIKLFTETEELATYFRARYAMDVMGGFFMPCSLSFSDFEKNTKERTDVFRVGVFGGPRTEKGSERIAPIIRSVAKRLGTPHDQTIQFLVQGSIEDFSKTGVYRDLADLINADGVSVLAVSDRLSPQEFEEAFKSVDVILLPYDVEVYGLQGSGVIQDAVMDLKPIVYSNGMAMKEFLSHGNALAATSNGEFAEKIAEIMHLDRKSYENLLSAKSCYEKKLQNVPHMISRETS